MVVRCKKCNSILTNDLMQLQEISKLNEVDNEDYIQTGFYFLSDVDFFGDGKEKVVVNKADLINAENHPNKGRLNGCCGLDGLDGLNKVCIKGHEVGTECSDCWMPHYVIFELDLISIEK